MGRLGGGGGGRFRRRISGIINLIRGNWVRIVNFISAGLLEVFQLAEATVDGALEVGLAAGEPSESFGCLGIFDEGGCHQVGFQGAAAILWKVRDAFAKDLHFHDGGAGEAPLGTGDAADELVFAVADGAEALFKIVKKREICRGFFSGEDQLFDAQAMFQAVAAGSGFAFGGAGSGAFLGVLMIGFHLRGSGHLMLHGEDSRAKKATLASIGRAGSAREGAVAGKCLKRWERFCGKRRDCRGGGRSFP